MQGVSKMADMNLGSPDTLDAVAPGNKIQVTSTMIEAGADLIQRHFYEVVTYSSSVEALALEVYQAMENCRLLSLGKRRVQKP
jgi:hypothetical protein